MDSINTRSLPKKTVQIQGAYQKRQYKYKASIVGFLAKTKNKQITSTLFSCMFPFISLNIDGYSKNRSYVWFMGESVE